MPLDVAQASQGVRVLDCKEAGHLRPIPEHGLPGDNGREGHPGDSGFRVLPGNIFRLNSMESVEFTRQIFPVNASG
jgi:hypothetical protein